MSIKRYPALREAARSLHIKAEQRRAAQAPALAASCKNCASRMRCRRHSPPHWRAQLAAGLEAWFGWAAAAQPKTGLTASKWRRVMPGHDAPPASL